MAGDTNDLGDIFVHDTQTGVTTRVSVDSSGGENGGTSFIPSISSDGRYVAFYAGGSGLVPDDTNGWYDIAEYYQEKRLCKGCEITILKIE